MTLALLVLGGWMQPLAAPASFPAIPLQVRVYIGPGVDHSTIERARDVAHRLLAAVGIQVVWHLCGPAAVCDPRTRPRREVPVIVSPAAVDRRLDTCGRALLGERAGSGAVMVSMPCVAGLPRRLQTSRSASLDPLLQSAAHHDLLGAVVAHELGHVLGLQHAPGLMQATLDPYGVVALRRGRLSFTPSQGARMRAVLVETRAEALARGLEP